MTAEPHFLDRVEPFSPGTIHTMIRPGAVVTQSLWPETPISKIHVVRIGGAGMSAVARLALDAGYDVTGSESQDGQFLAPLRDLGARITVGFDGSNIEDDTDLVVVSTAVRPDNPEVLKAREQGIPVIHRASALAGLLRQSTMVAVAGTHGKTTTTSMAAMALRGAGQDPAWAVGAAVPQLGANAGFGSGEYAVVEADESDGSFLAFAPRVLILTNFEADHLDFHETYADLRAVTSAFVARLKEADDGVLVACADDPGSRELALEAREHGIHTLFYGEHDSADWRIVKDNSDARGAAVTVASPDGKEHALSLHVPGRHNVLNALGALIAGVELGFDPAGVTSGLGGFTGAQRRFQSAGAVGGVEVVDDYAHHPREVAATVGAGRERAGDARLVAVFQPHLFSRTKAFAKEFAEALSGADEVVLLPIYAAREDFDPSITSEDVAALIVGSDHAVDVVEMDQAPKAIADAAGENALVLMMGAGDIVTVTPHVLDELRSRG